MKLLDITENMSTARLGKVVTALTLTEELDPKTRRTLTGHARAVRLLAEAGERSEARVVACDLAEAVEAVADLKRWHRPVRKAVENVDKALR